MDQKYSAWAMTAVALVIGLVVGYAVGANVKGGKLTKPTEQTTTQAPAPTKLDVQFANHIQAGLAEQDVFVESDTNKAQVVRVKGDENKKLPAATEAKAAYAGATAIEHDPFGVGANPLGPFAKGKSLGFTLASWLAATGSGTYTVTDSTADVDLSFTKLVPNGVYTLWCSRVTLPPNVVIVDKPCGAADGSENSFKADANGNGSIKVTTAALEASTEETVSVLAIAYHSDGKTYGDKPGEFGLNSHVQLAYLMPAPGEPSQ